MNQRLKELFQDIGFVLCVLFVAAAILVAIDEIAYAEQAIPMQTSGYYQMTQGEIIEQRCPVNPDGIQPAVNMVLIDNQWRVIVACPEVVTSDEFTSRR